MTGKPLLDGPILGADVVEALAEELGVSPASEPPALAVVGQDGRQYDLMALALAHVQLIKFAQDPRREANG